MISASCGFEPPPALTPAEPAIPAHPAPPPKTNIHSRLARPILLELIPFETDVSLGAARQGIDLGRPRLSVRRGSATMARRADDEIELRAMTIELEDAHVSRAYLPPEDRTLTGLRLTLRDADTSNTAWFGSYDEVFFESTCTVRLEWSLVTDDGALTLMPQDLSGVQLIGHALLDDRDNATMTIDAVLDGVFFQWADIELFNAQLHTRAVSTSTRSSTPS